MSGNTVIGWDNVLLASALTASSQVANLPVQYLQENTGSPSTAWQTLAGVVTSVTMTARPGVSRVWRAFGLFRTNLTAAASVTFALWQTTAFVGDVNVWSATVSGPAAGYGQVIAVAAAPVTADYLVVTINDAANPDGHINIPLAFAGPAWVPDIGAAWQTTFGYDSLLDEQVSRGGQEYPVFRWRRRRWDVALSSITGAELWVSAEELDRIARQGGNNLFINDLSSASIRYEAVFGRVEAVADVSFVTGIASLYSWRFRIRERL